MRSRSKSVESYAFAALHAGNAQRPKTDDACAKQRCGVAMLESIRQWDEKLCPGCCIFRIPTVAIVSRKYRCIAEILPIVAAKPTRAVDTT